MTAKTDIVRLKVTLDDVEPAVTRDIAVPLAIRLHRDLSLAASRHMIKPNPLFLAQYVQAASITRVEQRKQNRLLERLRIKYWFVIHRGSH